MKTRIAAMLILTALLMNSCGIRRQPTPTIQKVEFRGVGWVAVAQDKPDTYLIIAANNQAEADAVKAVCNTKVYLCIGPEFIGDAMLVERRRK